MIIDCEKNPDLLIDEIGDREFFIDEDFSRPNKTIIRCCEDVLRIEISVDEFGDLKSTTAALLELLNQNYKEVLQ